MIATQRLVAAVTVATGPINAAIYRQARGGHELSCQAAERVGRNRGMAPIGSIRPPQQGQRSCV